MDLVCFSLFYLIQLNVFYSFFRNNNILLILYLYNYWCGSLSLFLSLAYISKALYHYIRAPRHRQAIGLNNLPFLTQISINRSVEILRFFNLYFGNFSLIITIIKLGMNEA